ncbi:MAG: D-alanyl-D-alanine carboxypeptidase [Bacilli bacterium]|nr:D-alanyl-D-alanine carboxypeptidase [Bacilli bacterium]
MKKVLFSFLCLFAFTFSVDAEELVGNAKSAILIEASTGEVLYEMNADEALAPASMTKIMTLLLTMEAIEKGNIGLEDKVSVSERAASMGGSQVFLEAGSEYTLDEIIKAVCIASGNDAAVVLAEAIGGSVENFVSMMNKRAKELGLTSTNFVNVYGLDAEGHLSSARDMAKMGRELIRHELILQYSSIYEEYLQKKDGSTLWMVNTNKLVRFYQGVDGLKTGFTGKAGYCLTATGKWKGMRLISVVMGEPDQDSRTKDTVALLNFGKGAYKINTILEKGATLGTIEIDRGEKFREDIVLERDATDLIKNTDKAPEYHYELKLEKVTAPIEKGKEVGTLELFADGEKIDEIPVSIKEAVERCKLWTSIKRIFKIFVTSKLA